MNNKLCGLNVIYQKYYIPPSPTIKIFYIFHYIGNAAFYVAAQHNFLNPYLWEKLESNDWLRSLWNLQINIINYTLPPKQYSLYTYLSKLKECTLYP